MTKGEKIKIKLVCHYEWPIPYKNGDIVIVTLLKDIFKGSNTFGTGIIKVMFPTGVYRDIAPGHYELIENETS